MSQRKPKLWSVRLAEANLALLVGLLLFVAFEWPDHQFHLWVLDVGQGDAILIQTPGDQQILVDGGPGDAVIPAISARMPFWDRTIERIILTHPHADHLTGLVEVLRRYQVGEIWVSGAAHTTPEYRAWAELIAARGIPTRIVHAGDRLAIDGVGIAVLFPFDDFFDQVPKQQHDATLVTKVSYGELDVLLTGDIDEEHEETMLLTHCASQPDPCPALAAEILKVPHHGSRTGILPAFLAAVGPTSAIISSGAGNRYGHPHPSILEKLTIADVDTYRTDTHRTVEVRADGSVVVERP